MVQLGTQIAILYRLNEHEKAILGDFYALPGELLMKPNMALITKRVVNV